MKVSWTKLTEWDLGAAARVLTGPAFPVLSDSTSDKSALAWSASWLAKHTSLQNGVVREKRSEHSTHTQLVGGTSKVIPSASAAPGSIADAPARAEHTTPVVLRILSG